MQRWLTRAVEAIHAWEATFSRFERHPALQVSDDQFASAFAVFTERLRENYPFFHPSYARSTSRQSPSTRHDPRYVLRCRMPVFCSILWMSSQR
jgi:hypothetical protein